MSLITQCPACETMFKVVPDQLRISEGWVRCGQCNEIFNASQHLLTDQEPQATRSPATGAAPSFSSMPVEAPPVRPATPEPPPPAPVPSPPAPIAPARPAASPTSEAFAIAFPHEPVWTDPAETAPAMVTGVATAAVSETARRTPADLADHDAELPDAAQEVSFMHKAGQDGFWRRRSVRILMALLALALVAALASQLLLHERNRIVLLEPALRPVMVAMCTVARCEVGNLKQIESIVIDSSSFGRLRGDNYRLGFSLRNTATNDIAMPAIELSLTDAQDQAVIRRVILPAEFGAPTTPFAAGADWGGALALSVKPAASSDRIAGYRLLAFYP